MLTAFSIPKQGISSKELQDDISCACYCGDQLYIATLKGQLFSYGVTYGVDRRDDHWVKTLRHGRIEVKRHRRIRQMFGNPDLYLLIVLYEGGRYGAYDTRNLEDRSELLPQRTKHADILSGSLDSPAYRFAIASVRNIYIFEWISGKFACSQEFGVAEKCVSLVWTPNGKMVMGFKGGGYRIREYATGREKKVDLSVKTMEWPIVSFLKHDDSLLLQIDQNIGIFVDQEGMLVCKNTLPWSGQLKCSCISCGSYILGLLEGTVEVISLVDQKVVQKIDLPGATGLKEAPGGNRAIVYNEDAIKFLVPAPIKTQIRQCIQHLRIEKAFQLLAQAGHKKHEKRELHTAAGLALLNDLNFKQAFDHFESSSIDPRDLINLFPRIRPNRKEWTPKHQNLPSEDVAALITRGIVDKLNRVNSDESKDGEKQLRDEHENEATSQLGRFLWQRRQHPSEGLEIRGENLKMWVDTALLKLHVFLASRKVIRPFPLYKLLEQPNSCSLDDCANMLVQNRQYNDLALLYRSHNKVPMALQVLSNMGSGKYKDPNNDGISLTCEILTSMEASRDLWLHSPWVLIQSPQQAMRIFTSKSRKVLLDPDRVLDHLENISSEAKNGFNYTGKYLEFLVYDLNSAISKYHNKLGRNYLYRIAKHKDVAGDEDKLNKILEQLFKFIQFSSALDPEELLKEAQEKELPEAVLALHKKLERHTDVLFALAFGGPGDEGHEEAVKYCQEGDGLEAKSERFLALLDVYFSHRPEERSQEDVWNLALDIMEEFHEFISATKVLEIVPQEMSIFHLTSYLESVIQHSLGLERQTSIVKALYKTQHMHNTMELHGRQSEYHVISQYKVCCMCKKPLLVSVFWSYPNRDLVHHACRERYDRERKNSIVNSRSASKLFSPEKKSSRYSTDDLLDLSVEEAAVKPSTELLSLNLRPMHQPSMTEELRPSKDDGPFSTNPFQVEEPTLTSPYKEVELEVDEIQRNPLIALSEDPQAETFKTRERRGPEPLNPFKVEAQNPFASEKQPAKNPFRVTENSAKTTNPFNQNDNPFNQPSSSNPASALTRIDDFSSFL